MKTIIRESLAMIILIFAIMLILITVFFDYIKNNSIEITGATYQLSKEEQKILKEKQNYLENQNKIVLSSGYSITEEDLQNYKASGDLKSGQSNPFDEALVTEIIHEADGSIHYKVTDPTAIVRIKLFCKWHICTICRNGKYYSTCKRAEKITRLYLKFTYITQLI